MQNVCLIFTFLFTSVSVFAEAQSSVVNEPHPLASAMQQAVLVEQDTAKVKELLRKGFDISQPIGCGSYTALHGAVQNRNQEMVSVLIEAGAKPDDHMMLRVFSTYDRDLTLPKMLIDAGGSTTAFEHPNRTCLYSAVWYGNRPLVELILSQDTVDIDRAGEEGTPLSLAVRRGNVDIARLLLLKGADPKKRGHHAASVSAEELIQQRIAHLTELQNIMTSLPE